MASLAVKVAVKVRPLNKRENAQHEKECTIIEPASGNLKSIKLGPEGKAFTYDYVVSHTERADDFYKECVSYLVDGLFEGYNATVLAYGQTGSGKTYSMGTSGKMSETEEDNLGVVPRAAIQIFQMIDAIRQKYINKTAKPTITVKTKFLELYQDKLVDLYDCKNPNPPRITQDPKSGIQVNSKEREVRDAEEIIEVLQEGAQNRQVGGTNMNAESSRSHAVFIIDITQEIIDFESADGEEADKNRTELTAKFCLVDLAGSERLGKTGAEGGRKQEGIAINQGLLALGNVISALGNPRKKAHVNYRDTKLTLLLKDSLGGNSKTLMIACISPSAGEINETKNTLEYANRARSIKNTPKKNQDEASLQMAKLKEQIAELEAALQNCTCGNISAIPTRIKAESEEEQEAVVEKIVEDRPVVYQHRQSSTNSLLSSNPRCVDSPDGGSLRFAMSSCPIDNQTIMLEQKNEDLEAKIKSLQIVNTRISHNLSELKTRMALLKMSYKANSDKELNTMMTQQLQDYKLKNEELEMEMSCRKKYYSLLDEYRREREKRIEPFVNQNNERMAQDILNLAEEDICRRKEFYESLPALISRPRKRKRKRRAKYRLLPKQLSPCLFDLADFENASEEVLNTVDKAEKIYSSHRAADYAEGEESIIYDNELKVILEEREKTKQRLDQLTLGFNGKYRLEQENLKQTMEMEDSSKESEPTLYSAEDYAHASGEVLAMMRRDETRFAKERAQQKLKEIEMSRKESEANANAHASEENKEPTLYSAEDYAHASGEVLAMMRRDETRFAKERAQQKLKEKEMSRKESEANASLDNKEPTLYSAEDYAHASGEVLAMMRRDETRFAKERAQQKLKEKEMSRKESEANASLDNKEPTLYSAEDYAHASGEVLAMMRRDETRFAKERAQQKLKEKEMSRKESEANANAHANEENKEPTLYSAEDYAHASGEVLAMMRRDETRFAKERAQQKLKEKETSRKESEASASLDNKEPTLYSAEDYAHASGEVLAMMRRDETRFAKERAQQKLKELEMSRKESEASASEENKEPTLYSAEDYAHASGEVLAMMRRDETRFAKERAQQKLKEKETSRKESEASASLDNKEPTLYSAEDYAHASGEVLAMMRRDETRFAKERAQQKLKEIEMSKKVSEANSDASAKKEEPTLYCAEDYAHASGEVLVMMRRDETRFAKERAQQKLKEIEMSRKESEANASVEREEKFVDGLPDTPDEISRNTVVPITRSKARVSLRDLKLSSTIAEQSNSEVIQESFRDSYSELEHEAVLTSSIKGVEEGVSHLDDCLPPQEDILNSTIREDPINLSKHIPEAINSSLFPAAKQHCDAEGDLISYLPEEDQAIQVALMDICTVTVPPLDPPVEIPNSEPSNPYFLKYLDFSSDSNSAFDSDENEHVNEANELNSNTEIWNPDVLILCEDINLRKKLSKQLKQERIDHSNLKKQNCQRVAELETKICRLQDSRDQLMKELNESNNITKALKNTKKNSDEKKVSNLSKDLTEEKKKVTSLNKDLNDEKKKSKQLEKELTQTRGNENWKIAFETSEKKRKELEANMKVSQKKADIKVKDQANKIKDFEKKAEIQMTIEKSKTKEVNKFIADNSKLNREYSESKKKIENLGQKNSRLQSLLTETMAKLTKNKSSTPATVAKKNATKTTDISGKLGEKNVPSRTPSMRECKDQESKDPAKYLELIETLVKNNLNKPAITQHIKAFVEKRVTSQLDKNRKLAVKKVAAVDLSRKERRFDKSFQKDDKSIDLKGLKFDAKKVAGNDLPEDINSFVSGLNEKRCKRTLEAMFLHSLHEGARKKAREIEEERLSTTNAELAEKVYRMEKIKTFFKDDLVVVDTRAKTNDPSTIHSYSTSDLSHIKLNRLPPQDAPVTIKVPSSENIRASSPNLSGSSRHNTSRSNLSARSCYHGGLSSNSNSNSTSNLRSSSPAKSISSLQNKPNTASSTGSLCPNKQACLNKSPAKHPPLVRTKTQVPLPNPRDPVKKAVSVSTPPSTQTRNFSIGQSADDAALLSPTTKPPLLLQSSFPPRSNSNKKTAPNTNQPACTSKRVTTPAVTPITIRHTNSPAVLHPTTKSSSAVSPTHCSNPGTPLSPIPARHTSIQIKPKQLQQTEAIQSTKIPPTKVVTHPQETQSATHQKHKQPSIKAPRKLDILKPNTTFSDEELKSILTLRMEEDSLFIASSEYTIRCIDLETMQEKYAQRPIRVTDIVRKLEYRVSDKLLYVSSGKKIEIFDLRSQQPVFEIKSFCGDKSIISDMVTTMDPNLLYLACGPDVLVWELTSNKLYGKLTGNTSAISKMCYGVRESKYPLLAICCKDQSVKIYDYPEAYWSKLAENPTDSTSSSSLNKIPSLKPARLSAKSFSLPENVYSPLFQGFLSKPPFAANKMAYLNNSSIVHYSDVLLLSNNVDILQYNIQEKRLQNQINHIQSSKNSNKNMSDISNMVRFPNQPLLVTTCRKGSVNFWDPITLKLFSKQNYYANTQFLYENQQVMSLSCNSRMIATTSNKNPHLVKLWNVDMDFLNSH